VDIKSFISILKFDVRKQACACRHAADFVIGRGESERKKERERVFLVSQGVRGDKNRDTLYRFVGRAAFTIFLRAVEKRQST